VAPKVPAGERTTQRSEAPTLAARVGQLTRETDLPAPTSSFSTVCATACAATVSGRRDDGRGGELGGVRGRGVEDGRAEDRDGVVVVGGARVAGGTARVRIDGMTEEGAGLSEGG
jgi:hypothetical protein